MSTRTGCGSFSPSWEHDLAACRDDVHGDNQSPQIALRWRSVTSKQGRLSAYAYLTGPYLPSKVGLILAFLSPRLTSVYGIHLTNSLTPPSPAIHLISVGDEDSLGRATVEEAMVIYGTSHPRVHQSCTGLVTVPIVQYGVISGGTRAGGTASTSEELLRKRMRYFCTCTELDSPDEDRPAQRALAV